MVNSRFFTVYWLSYREPTCLKLNVIHYTLYNVADLLGLTISSLVFDNFKIICPYLLFEQSSSG